MLNSHDYFDKQVIAAVREYDELCRRRYTIIKLDLPIQRGWRRFHALSERALGRRDRPLLEAILAVIGTTIVHHSRDFRKRRGRRSKKLIEIEQPPRPIPIYEWERKQYPVEWLRYFRRELLLEWNRHWQPYWVLTQPSLYELKVEPNWLWYFREVDPTVESRLSELSRWLEAHEGWRRYAWLKGRPQHYRWNEEVAPKEKSLRRQQQREVTRALNDFPEVDPAAPARRIRLSLRQVIVVFPGVAQCRGNELRPRRVRVRVLPPGPL
jgi:hypothetical protein